MKKHWVHVLILVDLVDLVTTQASSKFSCLMLDAKLLVYHVLTVAGPHQELAQVNHLKRMHHQRIQIDKLKSHEKPMKPFTATKSSGFGFHEISSSCFQAQTSYCICSSFALSSFWLQKTLSLSGWEKHAVASEHLALLARSSERQAACTARLPSEKRAILTSNASNTSKRCHVIYIIIYILAWTTDGAPKRGQFN